MHDGQFMLRMNFPTRHPLNERAAASPTADFVLGLEKPDLFLVTHRLTPVNRMGMEARRVTKAGAKIVTISSHDLLDEEQLPGRRAATTRSTWRLPRTPKRRCRR